jgi:DNA-binding LacI/PurR family transcriptional regulator
MTDRMTRRVTIKSIADSLGISHMTVSRALSDHPSVRPETRAAVQARAEAMGYVPSAAARAMRGDTWPILGLVLPNLLNEFYARLADALAREGEAAGLHVAIDLTNDDAALEDRALARLEALNARAVLRVPPPASAIRPHGDLKVIDFIRRSENGQGPALLVDDGPALAEAVDLLVGQGHRRIAYIGADLALSSGAERHRAVAEALARHGLSLQADITHVGRPGFDFGAAAARAIVAARPRATAVITAGFEISNGALDACLEMALSFPRDIAFVGYGDPAAYRWLAGGITTVSLPVEDLARAAVRLATEPQAPDATAIPRFPARLVRRGSA